MVFKPTQNTWTAALNNSGTGGISLGTSSGKSPLQVTQGTQGLPYFQPASNPQATSNPQAQTTYSQPQVNTVPAGGGTRTTGVTRAASGTSAPAAPTIDLAALAAWDQSINQANLGLGNLDSQYTSGVSTINADTANALATLLGGYNTAESSYKGNVTDNQKSYIGAKNTIGVNAGNALNGIQRLLGSRGVRGTDTDKVAPGAVARVASQQRGEAGQGFAKNAQALDTNWGNYKTGYGNQVLGVKDQQERNTKDLRAKIDTTRSSLLQTLANATSQRSLAAGGDLNASLAAAQPFINQANQLNASASNYTTPAINYQTQAYNAPALDSYTAGSVTPTFNGKAPTNDYASPFLSAILGEDKKKNQSLA